MRSSDASRDRLLDKVLLANLVAEILIIGTGGLVRVTGSGLGCPTWPQCVPGSYVPVREQAEGFHKYIEFGNRTLTGALGFIALAALWAVWTRTDRRRSLVVPAVLVLVGIAAQAILGGITVRTGLHPGTVAAHFLLSGVLVALSAYLWLRSREPNGPMSSTVRAPIPAVAYATTALGVLVLVLGTIVTGSGPHSGDADQPARLGFNPRSVSWLHADAVMLFIGLVFAVWLASRIVGETQRPGRAWAMVLGVTALQGVVGYTQYALKLPEVLVVTHMLLAALLIVALVNGLMSLRDVPREQPRSGRGA